jgi:hypothetical protein
MSIIGDAVSDELNRRCREAIDLRNEWLEDVIAGLLAAGCTKDELCLQEYPNMRTVVCVNGVPKYEFKIEVVGP